MKCIETSTAVIFYFIFLSFKGFMALHIFRFCFVFYVLSFCIVFDVLLLNMLWYNSLKKSLY